MSVSDIMNLILSIVTVAIASYALWQTHRQTGLSNKQQLFDKRVEKYRLFKEILLLYSKYRDDIKDKDNARDLAFLYCCQFTNCAALENINALIDIDVCLGAELISKFQKEISKLKMAVVEIQLLWKSAFAKDISDFIEYYGNLITLLFYQYGYEKLLDKNNKMRSMQFEEYEQKRKNYAKESGLNDCLALLDAAYIKLIETKAEQQLIDSIRL